MRLSKICLICVVAVTGLAWAQSTPAAEPLAFSRPESWVMKYFASATLLTGLGPAGPVGTGLKIGLEGDWLPYLSEAQRTVGFEGTKVEDLNKVPVLGRLRLDI